MQPMHHFRAPQSSKYLTYALYLRPGVGEFLDWGFGEVQSCRVDIVVAEVCGDCHEPPI